MKNATHTHTHIERQFIFKEIILTAFVSNLYFQMKGKAPYLIIFCTKQQIWTVGVVTAVLLCSYITTILEQ
jgi:hypothetical protein